MGVTIFDRCGHTCAIFWMCENVTDFAQLHIQGQPLGFDTKYLALVDRNMQVRFSLKVVWES